MRHHFFSPVAIFTLGSVLAFAHAPDKQVEQHLRDEYQGKEFLLRGFYSASRLRYDATGSPDASANGDWTVYGFVHVTEVHLSSNRVQIKAKRLLVTSSQAGFRFGPELDSKKNKFDLSLVIEVALSSANSDDEVQSALSRIFLTSHDRLEELVPEYWRACVADGLAGKNRACAFSEEVKSVPGVTSSTTTSEASEAPAGSAQPVSPRRFAIGKGVSPPKLLNQHEPEFSEPARQAKYQGTMTISLIVDQQGVPTHLHILSPLGCGLDEKAVNAVSSWRFDPAKKDGAPVPVQIAVEVDFHLY
jgi:TonB family protein